jgi:hypothetical protein
VSRSIVRTSVSTGIRCRSVEVAALVLLVAGRAVQHRVHRGPGELDVGGVDVQRRGPDLGHADQKAVEHGGQPVLLVT